MSFPATAVTRRNSLVPGKREGGPLRVSAMVDRFLHQPFNSLLPFWWWVLIPTVRGTPSLKFREACEPPTRKRALSPFQGDTSNCPSLKGKGDRCASAQWWIGFYTDHSTLYYHSGGWVLTLAARFIRIDFPVFVVCQACEPPTYTVPISVDTF